MRTCIKKFAVICTSTKRRSPETTKLKKVRLQNGRMRDIQS